MRTFFAALVAACLLALGHAPAVAKGDPHADTRSCVANREANSLDFGQTRHEVEHRWEVAGLGVPQVLPAFGEVITYPWCDHSADSFVGVAYNAHRKAVAVVWYNAEKQPVAARNAADQVPTTDCISGWEFGHLPSGMTMSQIQAWFDATGTVVHTQHGGASVIKQYPWCGRTEDEGYVQIHYSRDAGALMADFALQFNFRQPLTHHTG